MVNTELQKEKDKLLTTQRELQKSYDEIERRVNDRTQDLLIANKLLQEEIHDRKKAEGALFASQKLLQEITDNSTSHIYALDTEGRFLLINRSLEKVIGVPRETLIGKTRDIIFPATVAAEHRANDLKVIQDLQPITIHEENQESDGIHIYISVKFPLYDTQGSLIGIAGISSDVTGQKQMENTIRENERLLRESQTIARLGSFSWDLSTGLWKSSKILDDIFGIDENYVRSLDGWANIIHPDWQKIMTDYVTQDVLGKLQRFDKEYKIIRLNDNEERWVHGNAELEYDDNHQPIKLIGTIIDITDRKQAEEAIITLNAELEQRVIDRTAQLEIANKELESFSYSVSHDLRAPLRHITGFISLFLKTKTSQFTEEELGYLNIVTESADQMGKLIDALLTFSRLNKTDFQKKQINTLQIIQQGLRLYEEDITSRKIEIITEPLYESYGDYQLLGQVWTNLISNAIKYTGKKDKPVIEIGSYIEGNETVFYIKDNGAGFNMKYGDKLFGVFQRLHKPRDFEGVGIGLANVNRIITRHGGRCWAKGEVDKGATFYFSLPNL
jgi:PAS domain S-box-containing protein